MQYMYVVDILHYSYRIGEFSLSLIRGPDRVLCIGEAVTSTPLDKVRLIISSKTAIKTMY